MKNAENIVLQIQKTVEDWAVVSSIHRHKNSPLDMPYILRPEANPAMQDLANWFCSLVHYFAVHDVHNKLPVALRSVGRATAPRDGVLPYMDNTRYGTLCARDIVRIWRRENGTKAMTDDLLAEVLDYVIATLSNTIVAIQNGDDALIRRAAGNMEATFRRVSAVDLPVARGVESYPVVVENAPASYVRYM